MLLFDTEIPLWVILCFILGFLLYWHGTRTYRIFKDMGVPYETPLLPYFTNVYDELTQPLAEHDLELSRRFPSKIFGHFKGRVPALHVADAQFYNEVMVKHAQQFINHEDVMEGQDNVFTRHLGAAKDDHWKHVRKLFTHLFSSGKLKKMIPAIEHCADRLVQHLRMEEGAPVIIKKYTCRYTINALANTMFGMDFNPHQSNTQHPFVLYAGRITGQFYPETLRAKVKMVIVLLSLFVLPTFLGVWLSKYCGISVADSEGQDYFEQQITSMMEESKDEAEQKNLVTLCTPKVVDMDKVDPSERRETHGVKWTTAGLTKTDLIGNATIFIVVGHESLAMSLQFFCYNMAMYPELQEKLYSAIQGHMENEALSYELVNKIDYLEWCIFETLRLFPPAFRLTRVASDDITVQGITIPKGMVVTGLIYPIQRDPEYWPKPDIFDPLRFAPENLTELQKSAFVVFGGGIRKCIGFRLGLLTLKVAVIKLIQAFRFEKTSETVEPSDMRFMRGARLLEPVVPIKVSAVPRC